MARDLQERILTSGESGAVYFDSVNGVAGTARPIGTAEKPVNNLADAKTIMAARITSVLKLVGSSGSITFDSDTVVNLIGNEGYDIYVGAFTVAFLGHVTCASLTNAGTLSIGSLDCKGPLDNTGATSLTINGDAFVKGLITNTTGEIAVYGSLAGAGNFATTTGNILVGGSIFISGSIIGTGTGDFTIGGDAYIGLLIQNDAGGEITISGNCYVSMTISNNDAASIFTVIGNLEVGGTITNAGTMTVGSLDTKSTISNTGTLTLKGDKNPHMIAKALVAADLTGTTTRFVVSGGLVRVKSLGFRVTTAIDAGANTLKFSFTPTGGAATDLCGAADTASAVLNQAFTITGVKADNLLPSTDPGIVATNSTPVILTPGEIQTIFSAGAPANGAGKLFIDWEPVEDGAMVY